MIQIQNQGINEYTIHLIRHGITEGNQRKLYYGDTDVPLAADGEALLLRLAEEGIYPDCQDTIMYTSGLKRTEQTLELIFGQQEHEVLEAFREFNFGDFEMKTHEDLQDNKVYLDWIKDKSGEKQAPNGESREEFARRVCSGFEQLLEAYKNGKEEKDTILVCHGGVIGVIMVECFPKEREHMFQWIPDPGHGYSIQITEGVPVAYQVF